MQRTGMACLDNNGVAYLSTNGDRLTAKPKCQMSACINLKNTDNNYAPWLALSEHFGIN